MSLYVSIDESYSVYKLSGLDSVVRNCDGYTLQDGRKVTKKIAQKDLKSGSFNIYDYEQDGKRIWFREDAICRFD
jgi:hypothetical protein|tara:strand:- start:77889 stop:78113 length:225 start_codon:yes stop_codon:yes gene_type:complete